MSQKQYQTLSELPRVRAALKAIGAVIAAHAPFLLFAIPVVLAVGWNVTLLLFPALFLFTAALTTGVVLDRLGRGNLLTEALRAVEALYRSGADRHYSWKRVSRTRRAVLLPALVGGFLLILMSLGSLGRVGAVILTLAMFVGVFFATHGLERNPREHRMRQLLASNLVEWFAPESDFSGSARQIRRAREQVTARHITSVEEVSQNVYNLALRNNVKGKSDAQFLKWFESVPNNIGVHSWSRADTDPREGFVAFTIYMTEKTDATSAVRGLLLFDEDGSEIPSSGKRVPFGRKDDGEIAFWSLDQMNGLIAGMPGSGKSATMASIDCAVSRLANVAMVSIDPKKVESGVWECRASFTTENSCCVNPLLAALYNEMERRYAVMKSRGVKKITPAQWDEFPLIVIVMDELAKVFTDPENPKTPPSSTLAYIYTRKLVAEGRAAGMPIIFATQRPSSSLVPTDLRSLIQQGLAHSMKKPTDTDMVLGNVEADSHLLGSNERGVGYFVGESDRNAQKVRSSLVLTDEERDSALQGDNAEIREVALNFPTIEEMAEVTAYLRVELSFLENDWELQEHMREHKKTEAEFLDN